MTEEQKDIRGEDLSAWLDGELDEQRAAATARKAEADADAARHVEELRSLNRVLSAYTVPAPPADLPDRILARVGREGRRPRVARFARRLVPAAAAAALLVAAVWSASFLLRPEPNEPAVVGPSGPGEADTPAELLEEQSYAFLNEDAHEREKALNHYDKLVRMSPEQQRAYRERAVWLKAVTDWLRENDPRRLAALRRMRPPRRQKALIELRDRLVAEGEIVLAPTTTRPADASAETE